MGSQRRNEESLTAAEAIHRLRAGGGAGARSVAIGRDDYDRALPRTAARRGRPLHLLLGIPAILGAAVLKFPDMLDQGVGPDGAALFVIGIISSAAVGYLAMKYFVRFLAKHSLDVFAWYGLGLAALTVVWFAVAAS